MSDVKSLGVVLRVNEKIVSPWSCSKDVSESSVTSDGKMSETDCGSGRRSKRGSAGTGVKKRAQQIQIKNVLSRQICPPPL